MGMQSENGMCRKIKGEGQVWRHMDFFQIIGTDFSQIWRGGCLSYRGALQVWKVQEITAKR